MKKTAFLFPGQGAQTVGMGYEFYQEFDFVRELFAMADEVSGKNISTICFKGPMEELTMTVNLQPAITAVNLAFLAAVEKQGVVPDIAAGHSVGEYSALCATGVISRADAIRLIERRGMLMHRESTRHAGAMCALIGLSLDAVRGLVDAAREVGVVSIGNHNSEQQVVITGSPGPVERVAALAREKGAKPVPLKVSGAWHSALMKGAEAEFATFLDAVPFESPRGSVVLNVTADFAQDPNDIKTIMARQLCSPVRWYESMVRLMDERVENFVEIGPGRVLTGLLKKIIPQHYPCTLYNINTLKSFEAFVKENT